jgi:thiosulfate dehydrogenase
MSNNESHNSDLLRIIHKLSILVLILVIVIALLPILIWKGDALVTYFTPQPKEIAIQTELNQLPDTFWHPRDIAAVTDTSEQSKLMYGRNLIAHTALYLGPQGSVLQISNGMNCQNCHLDAGTRPFGNNYGAVFSLYPKFRARSGTEETIYKRINDCIERSLNGRSLDSNGRELQAMKAYIAFIGSNVPKGKKGAGSGLKELEFLSRQANPQKGQEVYIAKCASCHGAKGEGMKAPDGIEYSYPPMWGNNSYNDAAGLYRLSNFARYVKYNMPWGVNHNAPQLSDEEAWDVAAFVNSQARPHKHVPADWPNISKKPIDHPFGPYVDSFSELQHKYGPFKPIQAFYQSRAKSDSSIKKS